MIIFVKKITPESIAIPIEVECSDTILNLKKKIEQNEGIPICHQRLVLVWKKLEDNKTFCDYQIGRNEIITLVPTVPDDFVSTNEIIW